ncbi:MAG: hypothetical protein LC637_13970, partial [Xanthomonadaceae bacterium]|nr:hypothetical protein [Xanthomonadaceae bacterium]
MISRLVATFAVAIQCTIVSAQITVHIDGLDFPVTELPGTIGQEIQSIEFRPSAAGNRFVVKTRTADQTCSFFQDGEDIGILPGSPENNLVIEIDLIEDSRDGVDLNFDFNGAPIPRTYPLVVGPTLATSGSITQMLLGDGSIVLDLCTSPDSCPEPGDPNPDANPRLVCREAGTRVFSGDFEPIVADLAVFWELDAAGFDDEVVAGANEGRVVTLTASNLGALDVASIDVGIDGILPLAGVACPQLLTAGVDFAFNQDCSGTWSIDDLAGGQTRQIEFRVTADADAQLEDRITLDASIGAASVDDVDPLNNRQLLDLVIAKQTTLQAGISSVPKLILDVTQPPASASFGVSLTPQGPSILNRPIDVQLGFPAGPNVQIGSPNSDFDAASGIW